MKGTVVKSTGSSCIVLLNNGNQVTATLKGIFRTKGIDSTNPLAVGDKVGIVMSDDGAALIDNIEERKNHIIRKATKLSKRSHIVAANIDCAYLMITLSKPKTHLLFVDRFLVTAEAYHIPVRIFINKTDIYDEKLKKQLAVVIVTYQSAGYECFPISALNKQSLEGLSDLFANSVNLMAGNSGVGKSTLINSLDPTINIKTNEVSSHHETGKHTTTFAEMHRLKNGGFIIDTPGLKSFATYDMEKEDLSHRFPEMRKIMDQCQFGNCQHINEPNCAVLSALEKGEIAKTRYKNYLDIYNSDEIEGFR
jgi:ribosome biogenesis GTPase